MFFLTGGFYKEKTLMIDRVASTQNIGRVKALLGILKLNDEEAYNHSIDVAKLSNRYLIKEEQEGTVTRTEDEKINIITGALLHDIGKAFLPFGLQYSKRKFTDIENEVVKTHPILGATAVQNCNFEQSVKNIILMHHALLDGTGYPALQGKNYGTDIEVPEYVWIIAYADKLDAMISYRNFKNQKKIEDAWTTLVNMSKNEQLPYENLFIFQQVVSEMDIFGGDSKVHSTDSMTK